MVLRLPGGIRPLLEQSGTAASELSRRVFDEPVCSIVVQDLGEVPAFGAIGLVCMSGTVLFEVL